MSIHDKAAANHARRYSLTVIRWANGCMQAQTFDGLTHSEVEAEKRVQRECYQGYDLSFEVSSC